MNIADLRQEYMRAGLSEADALTDPFAQFERWFKDALDARLPLANAMTLATVTLEGGPDARAVLLKGVDGGGFVFYTNYESRKGEQLQAQPKAALCLYWKSLKKQIRIEGEVEQVTAAEADAYFASRHRSSQIGAWASQQSRPLAGRFELEKRIAQFTAKFGIGAVPRPPHWSGFRVLPGRIEFWEEKPFRLHDRLVYHREGNGWRTERLFP